MMNDIEFCRPKEAG